MAQETDAQNVVINAGTVVGSTYSQLVNVSVTDIDITIEFVFVNPRDKTQSQVVSRVTLPKDAGLKLAELIIRTNQFHDKKKGGNRND